MSQPAIASSLLSFSPVPRRAAASFPARLPVSLPARPAKRESPAGAPHPSQLLDWLRLAARQVFGAELAARLEPYRACRCCVAQVRWCGEGVPARSDPWLQSLRSLGSLQSLPALQEITPLTSALILGSKADPYSPAESTQRRTRRLLERLAGAPREISGMEISILTRSPLLLRDLDLLVDLDRRHAVTVSVLIPAAEAELASRVEAVAPTPPTLPSQPSPDDRFDLVRTLAAHGIAARVLCTPVQPGLNNGVAVLRRLFGRAREAGACDVTPAPRHPALRPTAAESRQLLGLFQRLRLERGFPRTLPGRG
jgi:hypothetical protein